MNICVFGAASEKVDKKYITAVEEMGIEMGQRGHNLVFGAGANGLMGAAAKGVHTGGGKVTGVIPKFFRDETIEAIYDKCDKIIYTDTMQERKKTMEDLSDAFIIVPGGIGTLEEFYEVLTAKQLCRHSKPIALYNIDDYFQKLEEFMFHCTSEKFIKAAVRRLYFYFSDIEEMLSYIEEDPGVAGDVHTYKNG